eukprot:GHVT01022408.1.p1 GENE.GHVT01022408.1~~GHVT01022408.1.p1  ORF type:complete len:269 (-),score=27.90 GHVT01022408.1:1400-2206(-)
MSTVTFSQKAVPLEPHQQADNEADSDGGLGSCVGSKKRKIVIPVLAGAAISLAVSGVGYLLLAPGQRWMSGPDVGRKAEQIENRIPVYDPTPSGVALATPLLTPHRGPLRLASPGVESAFAAGQGRAAVARLVRTLEECGRPSQARRLAVRETVKSVCVGAWTLACAAVMVVGMCNAHKAIWPIILIPLATGGCALGLTYFIQKFITYLENLPTDDPSTNRGMEETCLGLLEDTGAGQAKVAATTCTVGTPVDSQHFPPQATPGRLTC